jgi:hypothetical protein
VVSPVTQSSSDTSHRFRDQQVTIWSFVLDAHGVLVRCPRCDLRATVISPPGINATLYSPRRLVCTACGHATDEPAKSRVRRGPQPTGIVRDPFFDHPLWLQTDCCGHVLWAYNRAHLDYLRSYIAADLRERSLPHPDGWHRRMTVAAKLPIWLKSAKNRTNVLRGIDRLRTSS